MREEQNILILGGTGAMGIALVDLLSEKGFTSYITTRKEHEDKADVHYIKGNAHDMSFLEQTLKMRNWDAIVDFMSYSTKEFEARYKLFLESTKQYIYVSSARVYAESSDLLTEQSARLLDVSKDQEYLKTDEYALTKARQENLLMQSEKKNWTIIRPSVTYNSNRLQLGVLEKEHWLYRALKGRTIVFSKDIGERLTALTSGIDVAKGIASIIGEEKALSRCFHITDPKSYTWLEILDIYLSVIEEITGKKPKVKITEKTSCFDVEWNKYQIIYCRYYDRSFDNSAIGEFCNVDEFCDIQDGIKKALYEFSKKKQFGSLSWRLEGVNDKLCGEHTPLKEMGGMKNKIQYILYRYLPSNMANKCFHLLKRK